MVFSVPRFLSEGLSVPTYHAPYSPPYPFVSIQHYGLKTICTPRSTSVRTYRHCIYLQRFKNRDRNTHFSLKSVGLRVSQQNPNVDLKVIGNFTNSYSSHKVLVSKGEPSNSRHDYPDPSREDLESRSSNLGPYTTKGT